MFASVPTVVGHAIRIFKKHHLGSSSNEENKGKQPSLSGR